MRLPLVVSLLTVVVLGSVAGAGATDDAPARDVQTVDVVPANYSALSGVHDIEAGSTMLVRGTTNRHPDDTVVDVSVIDGPDADRIGFAVVETWDTDGIWTARLTVPADATPGTYTLQTQAGGDTDTQAFDVVAEKRATLTVRDTSRTTLVVDATLPDGGYVELRDGDTVVGTSRYLEPGTHERVSIPVERGVTAPTAVAVVGTRERHLEPYVHDGAPVSVTVALPTPTPTVRPTATATRTSAVTTPPTATPTVTTTASGTGFGVAAAVCALLVALSVGRSR